MKFHTILNLCRDHSDEYVKARGKAEYGSPKELFCSVDGCGQDAQHSFSHYFIYPDAAALYGSKGGAIGGASTSEEKAAAARENGAKGGRPKNFKVWLSRNNEYRRLLTWINDDTQNKLEAGGQTIFPFLKTDVIPAIDYLLAGQAPQSLQELTVEAFQKFCFENDIVETTDYKKLTNDYALDVAPSSDVVIVRPASGSRIPDIFISYLDEVAQDGRSRKVVMRAGKSFMIEPGMTLDDILEAQQALRESFNGVSISVPNPQFPR